MVDALDTNFHRLQRRTNAGNVCRGERQCSNLLARKESADNDRRSFHAIVGIPTTCIGGMILKCMIDVSLVGRRERGAHATATAN